MSQTKEEHITRNDQGPTGGSNENNITDETLLSQAGENSGWSAGIRRGSVRRRALRNKSRANGISVASA